ncbi:gamma carbonic anhydrase family protein [Rhodoblastus sphagnicola]|uniref:Gamma carbonic anhydrase family protein n=1 Tax=Rhodoblastus sphagnicola TaxID=333368 RepID=A0A2S6MYT3_9HYPH|nr:gamma carbonic anhydrase family protein [Rhodoblastus sphagnicola]MBB4196473.1 carbonic anhydrase/acetyltransferase-like protein (isoleucine patch superfamily) [Rhodoblastus sphagnicola]PPQ27534.1 gamma carbonic anhydrase family protein [Rhodoblastus sphagnicola]
MSFYSLDGEAPELPANSRYFVAPDANVIGRVRLREDANIWFGATLRGDNEWIEVGARANIQDGCVLHTDMGSPLTIGDDVTVGHGVILHGCLIGEGSLIGMGATVMNNAKIGKFCIVGANALVTEGAEFPDYSLIVGAPAKLKKTLDPSVAEKLLTSARHYAENGRRYLAGLKRID